ncbi:alanine racemase [Candidatus Daviesbacteria bacterium RIFCSPHIGHO2_02_FULL_39_12]|uniref:Alanine racemase n=2 Tax=Candidatus Daviesiibacteriota TaxID=1752718 RepID=A0A1F5JCF1_9BACT|nr:MAG: alanine racemase [Candidatus Daviesbacteria bacterium RIFCSPHIGHO2_02_FULL_39_12]OGE71647.1 MAG: alanine racemase [Candidatus Daviesbacteria bacterium RIFCSPLOWO2_02_FULL_38_15]
MIGKILSLFKDEYKTLNRIEISKKNLLGNFAYLSNLNHKLKIAPVVKSNGYGHGILEVSKALCYTSDAERRIPFLCVDSLFEAYQLLKANIRMPILIMGFTDPRNLKVKKLSFSYAVYNLDLAKVLNDYQPGCKVHIFVDTGMGREGITMEQLPQFLGELKQLKNIKIEGLMSHLASSQDKHDKLFLHQIKNFKKAQSILKKMDIKPKWLHIAASGSIVNPETRKIIAGVSNLVRAGRALYGYPPTFSDIRLQPTLKFTTKLIQIKNINKYEKIGYNGTYTAKKNMLVGILPLGYYDGVDRGLSNKGVVTIGGKICPIIGRVSMNLTAIDLSKVKNPVANQQVIVYSDKKADKNSVENVAKICKKIPSEILVNLAASTKRVVV